MPCMTQRSPAWTSHIAAACLCLAIAGCEANSSGTPGGLPPPAAKQPDAYLTMPPGRSQLGLSAASGLFSRSAISHRVSRKNPVPFGSPMSATRAGLTSCTSPAWTRENITRPRSALAWGCSTMTETAGSISTSPPVRLSRRGCSGKGPNKLYRNLGDGQVSTTSA